MKYKKTGQFVKAVAKKNGIFQQNGVMFIKGDFSQAECDEFNGVKTNTKSKNINEMNKIELELKARTKGVELDRRKKKSTLTEKVKKLFK
jgi:hypothetical protein